MCFLSLYINTTTKTTTRTTSILMMEYPALPLWKCSKTLRYCHCFQSLEGALKFASKYLCFFFQTFPHYSNSPRIFYICTPKHFFSPNAVKLFVFSLSQSYCSIFTSWFSHLVIYTADIIVFNLVLHRFQGYRT